MPVSTELKIEYATRLELVAVAGPVVFRLVDGRASEIRDYERLTVVLRRVLEESPAAGLLQVLHEGTPPAGPEVRRFAAREFEAMSAGLSAVTVMAGVGFWSKVMRSSALSVSTFLRGSSLLLETTVPAGAKALALDLIGIDPARIERQYGELHEHMQAL